MNKVKILGQVFTPYDTAKYMTTLIKNNGLCLEPSSGDGIFLQFLKNYISIEYDKVYADKTNSLNIDFLFVIFLDNIHYNIAHLMIWKN